MGNTAVTPGMDRRFIHKEITRISFPAILNNITVPLLGLCDTAIAGHLGDARFLGAIAVGTLMLNVIYWLFGFLRMGTTGLTAQAFGASDRTECIAVLLRSILIAAFISIPILIFREQMLEFLEALIAPDEEVSSLAASYFNICIWAMPVQLCIMSLSGWFVGLQNTVAPMAVAISINVINIILSVMFVFFIGDGFPGIAKGTLIANWLGVAVSASIAVPVFRKVFRKKLGKDYVKAGRSLRISSIIDRRQLAKYFSVNSDLFFRSACVMAVSLTVTSIGARLGSLTLATNAVMMQFFVFFSYFMDGFAFSGEALCGRFKGERRPAMIQKTVHALMIWAASLAVAFFLIYLGLGKYIVALLTDNPEVQINVMKYHVWVILLPPLTVAAFIFDGIYIGLTHTRRMLTVTMISAAAFFIIVFMGRFIAGFGMIPSNNRLWAAFETYLLFRGLLLAADWFTVLSRRKEMSPSDV